MNVDLKCPVCDKDFQSPKRYVNYSTKMGWKVYCSKECQTISKTKAVKCNCYTCGKSILKTPSSIAKSISGKVFCSYSCSTAFTNSHYKSGINNPNYK